MANTNEHIVKAIRELGSQSKLAEQVGCSQQLISSLARGEWRPTAEVAVAVERATRGSVRSSDLRPDLFPPSRRRARVAS